jgi:glucose/arabinose dehydrogenase
MVTVVVVALGLSRTDAAQKLLSDIRSGSEKVDTMLRAAQDAPFVPQVIATGLNVVWDIEFLDSHRALIAERTGAVRLLKDGVLQGEPYHVFKDVLANPKTDHTGLYDLEPSPDYDTDHAIYALYSVSKASLMPFAEKAYGEESDHWRPVVRLSRLKDTGSELVEEKTLLETDPAVLTKSAGGRLRFGPDGKLYVTTPFTGMLFKPQDRMSLLGKTLRLNPDGSVPSDNPFVGLKGSRPEIWTLGHKDAYGIDFRKSDGLQVQAENGPSGDQFFRARGFDEINVIRKGGNYGFPDSFGTWIQPGTIAPVWTSGNKSQSPGDARFLNSDKYGPKMAGRLLVSSMSAQNLRAFELDTEGTIKSVEYLIQGFPLVGMENRIANWRHAANWHRIRAIGVDKNGLVYLGTTNTLFNGPGRDVILRLNPRR